VPINSNLESYIRIPKNASKKWKHLFSQLDKFNGEKFCGPMLCMIAKFMLTPLDVCAIRGYKYNISIEY